MRTVVALVASLWMLVTLAGVAGAAQSYPVEAIAVTPDGVAPDAVAVTPETLVTWRNATSQPQTLVPLDGAWPAVVLEPGGRYARLFGEPGEYEYQALPSEAPGAAVTGTVLVLPSGAAQEMTPALTVLDQSSDGQSIQVAQVSAPSDGFVVIFPDDGTGQPLLAAPIGQAPVLLGETPNLLVPLSTPVMDGARLHAALYEDLGTPGVFEADGTDQPFQINGVPLIVPFTVSVPPTGESEPPPPDMPETGGIVTDHSLVPWLGYFGVVLLGGALLFALATRRLPTR